jgi:hypothetical protein
MYAKYFLTVYITPCDTGQQTLASAIKILRLDEPHYTYVYSSIESSFQVSMILFAMLAYLIIAVIVLLPCYDYKALYSEECRLLGGGAV